MGNMKTNKKAFKERSEAFASDIKKIIKKHNITIRALPTIIEGKVEAQVHLVDITQENGGEMK